MIALLRFILRRARQHWPILLTLSLGVVLATALLASGPLLVDAVVEMGLRLTLQSASVADGNLRLTTSAPLDQPGFQALDSDIQPLLQTRLESCLQDAVASGTSEWMFPWEDGQLATDQRVNLRFYEDIQDRVEYIAGEWPAEPSSESDLIRAVISEGMARSFVLRVGDRIPLSIERNSTAPDVWIEVVGVVRPQNPRDPYWFGEFGPLTSQGTDQHPVIVSADVFFPTVATLFPGDNVALAWHALLRHDAFSIADIEPFQAQIAELNTELDALQSPVTLHTSVPSILATFQSQLESVRAPLYIFVAEVMLLVLYFVTMIAALSVRQVERELAILRSRGTSAWQLTRIQIVEALIIAAVAFVLGPLLGAGLVTALAWVGPLADVGQAGWSLNLTHTAWLAAGIGALACLAGLLLPLGPALRRSIVTHQQAMARSIRPPWWQRTYLDVFVLVGGLALLWRLRLYGEMTTGGPGGARLDWLLLLSPVAFLLGAAAILLRVLPLVLRGISSLVSRGEGMEGPLALWQAARNPTHVTRLVLLLTLAIALGNLSMGLNTTLDQSEYDRAQYLAGNDLRLVSERSVPLVDLQSDPGALQLSGVWRGQGTVDLESAEMPPSFEILAIEPDSFSEVTTYRKDFSDDDMDELVARLGVEEGEHPTLLLLPGQPAALGLWLWAMPEDKTEMDSYARWIDGDNDADRVGLMAKLQTAQGELVTVGLQRPETPVQTERFTLQMNAGGRDVELDLRFKPANQGWHYFEGALPVLPPSSHPLSLHSLWFQSHTTRLGEPIVKSVSVIVDELTVIDAETQAAQIVEDFESPSRTMFLNTADGDSTHFGLFTEPVKWSHGSGKWGQVVWLATDRLSPTYPIRLRQTWTLEPLPAIASSTFMETTELEVGDVVRANVEAAEVDFRIVGEARYFPTMYEQLEAGYLLTSLDLLLAQLNDSSLHSTNPNEVLIETDHRTSIDSLSSLVPMLSQSWQADAERKALKANPLALGLRGVTFFGSALMILLSLVGFAAYFYLSVRQREMLYGVMRAMGMSARELYGSIVIEQAVLILTGLVLGTGLGVLLNQITLPRLPVSLGDRQPIPPFLPRMDWLAVGALYLFLAVALLVILGIVTALLRRARIHRILRIGQE
jgi:ABC-type antimicrobial peptide transport system permease subunit